MERLMYWLDIKGSMDRAPAAINKRPQWFLILLSEEEKDNLKGVLAIALVLSMMVFVALLTPAVPG